MGLWPHPEGVRVAPDGSWCVGEFRIVHLPSLRFLKERLVFEDGGAFLIEGEKRLPVEIEGPAFEVTELRLLPHSGEARAVLDDGSEEVLGPDSLAADLKTGRVECVTRAGHARAVFSRGAHQCLLEHVEEVGGRYFLRVGYRLISIQIAA